MKFVLRATAVFIFSLIWFSVLQPWGSFRDPDAFYHAKMAALMLAHGPVTSAAWLDLTSLGAHFFDQHFLFHAAMIPFVKVFGMLPGAQIAAVIFASLFIAVLFLALKRLCVAHPFVWTALAALSAPLAIRLSLAKASPLALVWFVVGVGAIARRRLPLGPRRTWTLPLDKGEIFALLAGLGFALTHGGWIILLVAQASFLFGGWTFDRICHPAFDGHEPSGRMERSEGSSSVGKDAKILAATFIGIIIGLLLHPNARDSLTFLWVQVVKIGVLKTSGVVTLGQEWFSPSLGTLISNLGPLLVGAGCVLFGLVSAVRRPLDLIRARQAIGLGIVVAVLAAATLKSYRLVEYLVPALTLWLATLSSLVDVKKTWRVFLSTLILPRLSLIFLSVLGASLIVHDMIGTWRVLHTETRSFTRAAGAAAVLSREADPGDRVFNTRWEDFPELFAATDRLRFVSGLDPTFLYEGRPEVWQVYEAVTNGTVTSTIYETISEKFGARFVFLDRERSGPLEQVIISDARFQSLYEDERVRLWRVESYPPKKS